LLQLREQNTHFTQHKHYASCNAAKNNLQKQPTGKKQTKLKTCARIQNIAVKQQE